jgi:hypothetical protein
MARLSLEEGRKEVGLLLEVGEKEFDSGNPLGACRCYSKHNAHSAKYCKAKWRKLKGRV